MTRLYSMIRFYDSRPISFHWEPFLLTHHPPSCNIFRSWLHPCSMSTCLSHCSTRSHVRRVWSDENRQQSHSWLSLFSYLCIYCRQNGCVKAILAGKETAYSVPWQWWSVSCSMQYVRYEVFTAVTVKNAVFWDRKPQFLPHRKYYVSATEPSRLMPCKLWGFHSGDG
jgi:hypothetical protein